MQSANILNISESIKQDVIYFIESCFEDYTYCNVAMVLDEFKDILPKNTRQISISRWIKIELKTEYNLIRNTHIIPLSEEPITIKELPDLFKDNKMYNEYTNNGKNKIAQWYTSVLKLNMSSVREHILVPNNKNK